MISAKPDLGFNTAEARIFNFLAAGGKMGALMRAHDWSKTPFGSPETWPQSLRAAVTLCLGANFPIAIYWGPELALLYNDAWSDIPGDKHPWALGRAGREVWPEIWDTIGPLYKKVQATGEGVWEQDQLLPMHRHGYTEECYFNFTFSPIKGEDGAVEGIFNAVVETTFAVLGKRRERMLRELTECVATARSEDEVFTLAAQSLSGSAADVPFCLFYRLINGQKAQLAGFAGIEPSEQVAPALIDLTDASAAWPFARAIETGRADKVEDLATRFCFPLPRGPWPEPVESACIVPIAAAAQSSEIIGFLIVGINPRRAFDDEYRSMVERAATHVGLALANVRIYEKERRRAEALAEIDRVKTAFFSNVSHEFRTPLSLMLGPIEDALSDTSAALPAIQRERLDIAHRNSLRLLKLVNTLLEYSRIEAGRVEPNFQPTDLAAFICELATNFRSATDKAGLALKINCPPLPSPVSVDRDMWEKIVLNLLSNAFKFTFEGEIEVRLQGAAEAIELTVRDTGVGIPPLEVPRLFERFHRVEGQKSRSFEGSGIGLALVQELIKLHRGAIRVESEVGRGTAVIVNVPYGVEPLSANRIGAEPTPVSTSARGETFVEEALRWLPGATPEANVPAPARGHEISNAQFATARADARVLIADDNPDMREYVSRLLGNRWVVEAVADGQAALDAIRACRPDIVLTDVMMPRLDGFGLLREIRADPNLRDLPVIMLSARAGEESRVDGLRTGADDYLTKPFSGRELIARVSSTLDLAKLRREATQALRESEQRFRTMSDNIAQLAWTCDRLGDVTWYNQRWLDYTGLTFEDMKDWGWKTVQHPDHVDRVVASVTRSRDTGKIWEDTFPLRGKDGNYRWFLSRAVPSRDAAGNVVRWFGTNTDISALREAETRQQLLINELNHRVKNTLATVQSIAAQTFRAANLDSSVRDNFEARLVALSNAHSILTQESWEGAEIHDILARTLKPHADPERLRMQGPQIRLSPKATLAISMGMHELATNAVKYGALSNGTGQVAVTWTVDGPKPGILNLQWKESGGPAVSQPNRKGFGSRLIERNLAHDLDGEAKIDYRLDGVICTITSSLESAGGGGGGH